MPDDLRFVAHPPERRRRSTTLLAAGCCCCCCCCFHSLGSIAGALYGMRTGHRPPPTPGLGAEEAKRELDGRRAADRYAAKIYWLALLIVAIVTTLVTIGENPREGAGALGISALIIAICLPLGQLGASVLALIYINVFPPARKPECLKRLGRITLFSFLWGLIGTALSWILLLGMK
jgi:hypothetical protein